MAAGILGSRVSGIVRERALAYFFGVGPHVDVFMLAQRGANSLQNLLGEGTISASFIPIYSKMIEEGRGKDAGRFAGAIFGLLLAIVAVLVAGGMLLATPLAAVLAPGFLDDADKVVSGEIGVDRFKLLVFGLRLTFPMAGLLVLSAWALGVLNSHRRFLLPYLAPVLWNVAQVVAVIVAAFMIFDDPFAIGEMDVVPIESLNRVAQCLVLGGFSRVVCCSLVFSFRSCLS